MPGSFSPQNRKGNASPKNNSPGKKSPKSLSRHGRNLSISGSTNGNVTDDSMSGPQSPLNSSRNILENLRFEKAAVQEAARDAVSHDVSEDLMFDSLITEAARSHRKLERKQFLSVLKKHGLQEDDERLQNFIEEISSSNAPLTKQDIHKFRQENEIVNQALTGQLVIPDFEKFTGVVRTLYEEQKNNFGGENADYIPQLQKVPDQWGVSLCTVDGQRSEIGDTRNPFCVQSCSKVITYGMAQQLLGPTVVHEHVGFEPSGRAFNNLSLFTRNRDSDLEQQAEAIREAEHISDPQRREEALEKAKAMKIRPAIPHNPLINAGAIMCASLVKPEVDEAERFDYVMDTWTNMCGYHRKSTSIERPTFANSTYLSERATADQNFCLAYMMRRAGAFFPDVDLIKTLESYFMYCSIECTANALSVVAATLANGGTCPTSGKVIFSPETVKNCLSMMNSCGMYDSSGEFSFAVGIPTKSGVGGGLMIVIPGVMGICTFSPRLDAIGNSVRGTNLMYRLADIFTFHHFDIKPRILLKDSDEIHAESTAKENPVLVNRKRDNFSLLMWAAYEGSIRDSQMMFCRLQDVLASDYDGRTALHVAASEGHLDLVRYYVHMGAELAALDRFDNTALKDAERLGHKAVADFLRKAEHQEVDISDPASYILRAIDTDCKGYACNKDIAAVMELSGMAIPDVLEHNLEARLSRDQLEDLCETNSEVLVTLQDFSAVNDWPVLVQNSTAIFDEVNNSPVTGKLATYIPELDKAKPDEFGFSICSTSGQQLGLGQHDKLYSVQACFTPLTYAMALEEHGQETVAKHVGREPSGSAFNAFVLDERKQPHIPHNPLINAGGLMTVALVKKELTPKQRIQAILDVFARASGQPSVGIDQNICDGEEATSDRNKCLAYMLNEAQSLPQGTDLKEMLKVYFACCAIMMNCDGMSVIAATLANGGVNPLTGEVLFSRQTCQDVLACMFSCGMYDNSGCFAFEVGTPCKSGVSGFVMAVIPNVMGVCCFSPLLDSYGNSARGIQVLKLLSSKYRMHIYELSNDVLQFSSEHCDHSLLNELITAASDGDVFTVRNSLARAGHDGPAALANKGDYDMRTALHLACAMGRTEAVKLLLSVPGINRAPKDRWGQTPLADARNHGHTELVELLQDAGM